MNQDRKDLIVANQGFGSTALALEPDLAEAVRRVIAAAESENTRRAYETQFAKFESWCARRGTGALPATPAVVAIYLTDLAETGADPSKPAKGAKVATVSLALSAISAAHRAANQNLDTKAREIKEAMKGIRRRFAAPQSQAEPLKPAMVRDILSSLNGSGLAVDRRDAALIALLFAAALRRSEICGLDYGQGGEGDGYLQLTSEAVQITLLRSKSRTEPVTAKIPRAENPGLVHHGPARAAFARHGGLLRRASHQARVPIHWLLLALSAPKAGHTAAGWRWRAQACGINRSGSVGFPSPAVAEAAVARVSPSRSAQAASVTSTYQVAGTPDSATTGSLPPHSRHVAAGNDNAGPALAVGTDSGEFTMAVATANPMVGGTTMAVATDSDVASETATDSCWQEPIADQVAAAAANTAMASAEWAAAADWFVAGGSPWPSVRALARHLGCHHKTAGDYVKRAERRKASQCTGYPHGGGGART